MIAVYRKLIPKSKFVFLVPIIFTFYYTIFYRNYPNLTTEIDSLRYIQEQKHFYQISHHAYNQACEDGSSSNPWIVLDRTYFFMRSAAYYFKEAQYFRALVLYNGEFDKNTSLILHFFVYSREHRSLIFTFKKIDTIFEDVYKLSKHRFGRVDALLNIEEYISSHKFGLNEVDIDVYIENNHTKNRTTEAISIKIRSIKQNTIKKKDDYKTLLCTKCVALNREDHLQLRWWIELSRKSGYTHMHICNQTIPSTYEFRQLFSEYNDFIFFSQMRCMPNFFNNNSDYLTSIYDFKDHRGYNCLITENLHELNYNKCYLDNIENYDYIQVSDFDEVILPQISEHAHFISTNREMIRNLKFDKNKISVPHFLVKDKCDRFFDQKDVYKKSNRNDFSNFLKYLNSKLNFEHEQNVLFMYAQALENTFFDNIFNLLDDYLIKLETSNTSTSIFNQTHYVIYSPKNYSISISGQDEFLYASNLVKLYNSFIKPFFTSNKKIMENSTSNYFDRVFLLTYNKFPIKDLHKSWYGKSIHHTGQTFEMNAHKMDKIFVKLDKRDKFKGKEYIISSNVKRNFLDIELGYITHYRNGAKHKFTNITVSQIYFDINYFNCYFLPYLKELNKQNINLTHLGF